jgi:hypothetical protein
VHLGHIGYLCATPLTVVLSSVLQEKDVVYTLSQLAPVAFHKEHHHHHEHGTIQRRASEVSSRGCNLPGARSFISQEPPAWCPV